MRILLDSHVLLWWIADRSALAAKTHTLLADETTELLWSPASTWELGIKIHLGKLRLHLPLDQFVAEQMASQSLTPLPIQHAHAARAAMLPPIHRDPFDRMLVAQAMAEDVPLLTADKELAAYGVQCLPA